VHGRGPVRAVVIHGWFYDWRIFESMLPALDPEVFSLAFMDCRGYGSSRAMSGTFDVDTMAADAVELASHLAWERFAVVGHSMGGKAALRAAASAPHRVTRILALTPVWAGGPRSCKTGEKDTYRLPGRVGWRRNLPKPVRWMRSAAIWNPGP
jgi:pimeloyl-ACP methyl ester carboxylesterase